MLQLSFLILSSTVLLDKNLNNDNATPFSMRAFTISGRISMNPLMFIGIFANIGGLVFYFTSGAFALLSASLELVFQGVGMILIYFGIALILKGVLGSFDGFIESLGKRT